MSTILTSPWPWYVVGPLIGLTVPVLLLLGNRLFGVSSNLRHMCAAIAPTSCGYLSYDWRKEGGWNLAFAIGIVAGGFLAGVVFKNPDPVAISAKTHDALTALGIRDFSGLVPAELFSLNSLFTLPGAIAVVGGGFLVGFGTAYAGGCTSGHGISGLANLELPSLIAVVGFFLGGIVATMTILPLLLSGATP
jgi:uncharacterized protein